MDEKWTQNDISHNTPEEKFFTPRYVAILCICVVLTLLFNLYIAGLAFVVGDSMLPTLKTGDLLFVDKISKDYNPLDIVVVQSKSTTLIKRIIGTPGDSILIQNGMVYVNGVKFEDAVAVTTDNAGIAATPISLKENEYFVMGDNRANSRDSRDESVGIITLEQIVGEATFSLLPFGKIK